MKLVTSFGRNLVLPTIPFDDPVRIKTYGSQPVATDAHFAQLPAKLLDSPVLGSETMDDHSSCC